MKRVLMCLLACLLLLVGMACAETSGSSFEYKVLSDGTISITGYTGYDSKVVVPERIDGRAVSEIAEYAFYQKIDIASVYLPDSITKIGNYAFQYCIYLDDVSIPQLYVIGENPFAFCGANLQIQVRDVSGRGNMLRMEDSLLIDENNSKLIAALPTITYARIPNDVTMIGAYAFAWCEQLSKVSIPSSVLLLGENPFYGCTSLTDIELATNHPYLRMENGLLIDTASETLIVALYHVSSVEIPNDVSAIGASAFAGNPNLSKVTIYGHVTDIHETAFAYSDYVTLAVAAGSVAERFASQQGIAYTRVSTTPTPKPTPTKRPTPTPTKRPTPTPTLTPTPTPRRTPTPKPTATPLPSSAYVSYRTSFTAWASSTYKLKYNSEYTVGADMVVDGNLKTAWNEGADGDGIGEWIALQPTDGYSKMYYGFEIANGFQYHDYRKGDRWVKNNRVTSLSVYGDGDYIGTYKIRDLYDGYDTIYFEEPVYCYTLKFVIGDTAEGSSFSDTCISEIRPF